MARILINALASTAGGGRTYLRNVLPRLGRQSANDMSYVILVPAEHRSEYRVFESSRVEIRSVPFAGGLAKRWWWEQTGLRRLIGEESIDLLVALGNFAMWQSPVPQILFNRSDLNFSQTFRKDLLARREWAMWCGQVVKSILARISIRQATVNVVPTKAFGERIRKVKGRQRFPFEVLTFGFDRAIFQADLKPPDWLEARLHRDPGVRRLLYVSHYNYFRNFETLLRALPELKRRVLESSGLRVELVLTTEIARGAIHGGYDSTEAARLIEQLGIGDDLQMLGGVRYEQLHHLYERCDLFVCPSYSESFGHPLVEAMAGGMAIASADLPVHREVCGDAAAYFAPFEPGDLARCCAELLADPPRRNDLGQRGLARIASFSWDAHVLKLAELIDRTLTGEGR
ncbi:MAG: glycosyltransferase family 4 protein [Blastocatellia bacterium]